MSVLGSIFGKIFGRDDDDRDQPGARAGTAPTKPATTGKTGSAAFEKAVASPEPTRLKEADVEKLLDGKVAEKGQALNWKTSIVDLMKALDVDSGLENRKALADELGYTGDKSDSAAMNVWLHKQVMQRIALNGGRVPTYLTD